MKNNKIYTTGFVVDVESDGEVPGLYSMTDIGIVLLNRDLSATFKASLFPITFKSSKRAMEYMKRDRASLFDTNKCQSDPTIVMQGMYEFVTHYTKDGTYPLFLSDNPGFDFAFVNYYFHACDIPNPFGHTSRGIGDIFRGINKNMNANFKPLRDTKHTHDPLDDAMGNAEALIKIVDKFGMEGLMI